MSNYRSTFSVGGVPLDQLPTRWVSDSQKLHGPENVSMAQVTLPGRSGELPIPSTRTFGASTWTLDMVVTGVTYPDMMKNKAALEGLLSPASSLVTITETMKDNSGKGVLTLSTQGYLVSADQAQPWNSPDDGVDLHYEFRIPSGVWSEPRKTVSVSTGTYTPADFVGGSAPQTDVQLKVGSISPGGSITISSSASGSAVMTYKNDSDNAQSNVVINTGRNEAIANGTRVSNYLLTSNRGFYLGTDGKFTIQGSGFSGASVTSSRSWF